jgi:hypothetical protein
VGRNKWNFHIKAILYVSRNFRLKGAENVSNFIKILCICKCRTWHEENNEYRHNAYIQFQKFSVHSKPPLKGPLTNAAEPPLAREVIGFFFADLYE